MPRRLVVTLVSVIAAALLAVPSRAQDTPKSEPPKPGEAARPAERSAPGATRAMGATT